VVQNGENGICMYILPVLILQNILALLMIKNQALKKYSNIDDEDFEDIGKAIVVVKDQLDLLNKLFIKFDSKNYFS